MYSSGSLYGFLVIGGMLAITPGPNMVYVMSRSIAQGRTAGLISLAGVMVGYLFYMFGAAFGITTLFLSVPYAGTVLGVMGAAYLLYLAWQAVRPGGRSPFEVKTLPNEQPLQLLAMLFVSLLPQFIDYRQGNVFGQSLFLGSLLIAAFASANGLVAICSSGIAKFLRGRPALLRAQRWAMGAVLGGLGVQMLVEASRMAGAA